MAHPTLYDRIGGAAGVAAAVQALHQGVDADPTLDSVLDRARLHERREADTLALTSILGGPEVAGDPGSSAGVLVAGSEVVRHLRDALWLLGVSRPLVDEVMAAVLAQFGRLELPRQA